MIQVTRKDSRESSEGMLRRFNRKIQQAGVLADVKQGQFFERKISKPERRRRAINRRGRKVELKERVR